jgi:hypothetical protein
MFVFERIEGALWVVVLSRARTTSVCVGLRTHSQLIPIDASSSIPRFLIFGMLSMRSIYAALQPVPKITAIRVFGLTYAEAMSVPVVSLMSAVSSAGTF